MSRETKQYFSTRINYSTTFAVALFAVAFLKVLLSSVRFAPTLEQVFYCGILVAWWISVERRIIHPKVRRCLRWTAIFMIIMMLLQCSKYCFLESYPSIRRWCWYGFYIGFVFIPVLSLYSAVMMDKTEYFKPNKRWYLILGVGVVLLGLVLTNDLHNWAFKIVDDGNPHADNYTHGFLYFIIALWDVAFFLAAFITMIKKSRIPGVHNHISRVIIPAVGGTILMLLVTLDYLPRVLGVKLFNDNEVFVFSLIVVYEALIYIGMIPSNDRYRRFFEACTLMVQIEDNEEDIVYSSAGAREVEERVRYAYSSARDYKVQSIPVAGGNLYWVEDIAEINRINDELVEVNARLSEDNELKTSENQLKEENARIKTRSELYDTIQAQTEEATLNIKRLLSAPCSDEEFKDNLALASFYGVYVKRQSNLLLIGSDYPTISFSELSLAIGEMFEILKLNNVTALLTADHKENIDSESATRGYEFIHNTIKNKLPGAKTVMVYIDSTLEQLTVRVMIDDSTESLILGGAHD